MSGAVAGAEREVGMFAPGLIDDPYRQYAAMGDDGGRRSSCTR